jgi:hypothetical protein
MRDAVTSLTAGVRLRPRQSRPPPAAASVERSLHYKRTGSLAEVAELLGDSKRVAAARYVYALTDYREVDRSIGLARATAK